MSANASKKPKTGPAATVRQTARRPSRVCVDTHTTGLTAQHYTSEDVFGREQQRIVSSAWIALCREDEIPTPGAYLASRLGDEPVVVVRDERSEVRVLSNVCRHRGMVLVEGSGEASRFQCPYHAWTYRLDGRLHGAPLMRSAIKDHDCDLPAFAVWRWGGFVFANADVSARPPRLSALQRRIENYGMADFHTLGVFEEAWSCNWKSLVENFMDAYHLSVVHPETLRPLTPSHLSRKNVSGKGFTSYVAHYAKTAPARKHHAPSLNEQERRQSHLFCVYPFLIASISADTLAYLMLQPTGVDRVRVRFGVSSFEAKLSRAAARKRIATWQEINAEDHAVLERLQVGLRSRVYQPGPLAPPDLEGCVTDFHSWYRRAMGA